MQAGKGDHMYYYIDEHPYCVPANEENELYRQIQSYGIKNIPRSEIQWVSVCDVYSFVRTLTHPV